MTLIINDDNLRTQEMQKETSKVRALLIDDKQQILVANYGGVYLLPGGSIDTNESVLDAIIRELQEELGENYNSDELSFLTTIQYYQRNYPTRDNDHLNRLVNTHYFVGPFKGISKSNQIFTKKEQDDNFKLELIPLVEIKSIVLSNTSTNPRNIYFQKELLTILDFYYSKSPEPSSPKVKRLEN